MKAFKILYCGTKACQATLLCNDEGFSKKLYCAMDEGLRYFIV